MAAPNDQGVKEPSAGRRFGGSALRRILATPLKWRKPPEPRQSIAFNRCAAQDPVSVVLEGDIIPRLLMAHVVDGSLAPKEERSTINAQDTQTFVALPLAMEAPDLLGEVDRFLGQGLSVEDVYLDLLAPAARHLGELWDRDECDFVDVTMGLWRLQEVMRDMSLRSPPRRDHDGPSRCALFCPVPGDVHSFGAQMIEEVFARAGWHSEVLLQPRRRELLDYVAKNQVDLIGLTAACSDANAGLPGLIKALRSVSQNPGLSILVGGPMINNDPVIVAQIGADGTGADARAALETAERLVPSVRSRARVSL
jgi:methanogenic corrinoid protein MtbC1